MARGPGNREPALDRCAVLAARRSAAAQVRGRAVRAHRAGTRNASRGRSRSSIRPRTRCSSSTASWCREGPLSPRLARLRAGERLLVASESGRISRAVGGAGRRDALARVYRHRHCAVSLDLEDRDALAALPQRGAGTCSASRARARVPGHDSQDCRKNVLCATSPSSAARRRRGRLRAAFRRRCATAGSRRRRAWRSAERSHVMLCGNPDMLKDASARARRARPAQAPAPQPGPHHRGELLVAFLRSLLVVVAGSARLRAAARCASPTTTPIPTCAGRPAAISTLQGEAGRRARRPHRRIPRLASQQGAAEIRHASRDEASQRFADGLSRAGPRLGVRFREGAGAGEPAQGGRADRRRCSTA